MNHRNGQEINTPQGSENQTSGVWGTQEGCDDIYHVGGCQQFGQAGNELGYQPKRINREICQGASITGGSDTAGGTFSQLIEDCREQIAGNQNIIDTLQGMNRSLEEKINFYERLKEQISKLQE